MSQAMDSVMEKIALLKNLAERAGTPEEAAAAAGRIQALMFKHNLSEFEVASAGRDERAGYDKDYMDLGAAAVWKQWLANSVGKFNFCRVLLADQGRTLIIVGRPNNITVTRNLYEYLEVELVRLAEEGWRERVAEVSAQQYTYMNTPKLNARRFKTTFLKAAVGAINERLEAQFEESKAQEGGSALVVVSDDELDKAVRDMFGRVRSHKASHSQYDHAGYLKGREAGSRVNLVNQIDE